MHKKYIPCQLHPLLSIHTYNTHAVNTTHTQYNTTHTTHSFHVYLHHICIHTHTAYTHRSTYITYTTYTHTHDTHHTVCTYIAQNTYSSFACAPHILHIPTHPLHLLSPPITVRPSPAFPAHVHLHLTRFHCHSLHPSSSLSAKADLLVLSDTPPSLHPLPPYRFFTMTVSFQASTQIPACFSPLLAITSFWHCLWSLLPLP